MGQKLEGCDEIVCRFLVAVCLLVVCLHLLLLLLDDLPDFLLQLWRDDELVFGVRLGGSVEVTPLLPDGGVARFLYEVLVLPLAGHGAVSSSPAAQSSRPSLPAEAGRGGRDGGERLGREGRG